ncbi:CotH kinase family protein [Lewinella sp. LCG006]|uniref:CotH kinase family protein n=1 Tax=Lewinella sp. LCG006 TaxID=3231911 RepID=UPI00345FC7AF
MKYSYFSLLIFFCNSSFAQEFYNMANIQTIEITFAQSNWDQLLDAEYAGSGGYIMAQNVVINGEVFDSVGVKYKGNSTYNANQVKNPFHIELDTYKDQEYDGYTDIKLSNVAKDPSFLREVLSYQILRQYMDAPLSNYANVYVNGNLIGLYSNSESISKKFVNSRFYSNTNTFFKCNPPDGAGPQSNDYPNLRYLGQDSTDYYDAYELKSDGGWQELIDLCDTLANELGAIEQILDVDRALWMLAFNNVLVNLDSYIGAFAQNYYLYRTDYGQFVPVIWDLNESFGRFSSTGSSNLSSTTAKQQMSHLLHQNDVAFPLVQKLLSVPIYRRMYIAHCKTILLENFDNGTYVTTAETLQNTIDAAVQADNNKFFTYANFLSNLTNDINGAPGPGGGATPGITNLMDGRATYLLGLADFNQTTPAISNITVSDPTPVVNTPVTISAFVSDENAVFVGYRSERGAPFTRIPMYDDGLHNDGAANDGTYATELPINNTFVQYYLYAENNNAGIFSPQRAEHEFHSLTATVSDPMVEDLVINEFMASNDITAADQDGEFDDWVELYNNSSEGISLDGYYLTDDADDLMKWAFPAGTSIASNGYLIIWADDDEEQEGLHTNFKLSAAAEAVLLVDPTGTIVDEVSYINQVTDVSYGRYPNGTGDFQSMSPTFNAENTGTTSTSDPFVKQQEIKVYPNPANDSFTLSIDGKTEDKQIVLIYNLNGTKVYQGMIRQKTQIDVSYWPTGLYVIKIGNAVTKVVVE